MSAQADAAHLSDPWRPRPHRVRDVVPETGDTATLVLEPLAPGGPEPEPHGCEPGQFNMLYLFGHGEAPISASGASEPGTIDHTIKGAGALTRALVALEPGALVGLRGPFGNGWPIAALRGRDVLLVAGGIGLAPIRSALLALVAERGAYGRIVLAYGCRSPSERLYRQALEAWPAQHGIEVRVTVDRAAAGWTGPVGFVTGALPSLGLDPAGTSALLCGPEVMMRHCLSMLLEVGLDPERVHLSMERNMRCAIGTCGHCQWGPDFLCRQGPVFTARRVGARLQVPEL